MATSKTKKRAPEKTAAKADSGALKHGAKAAGAAQLEKGFAHTAEQDLLFALGWPHMVLLQDDAEGADPLAAADAIVLEYPEPSQRVWPREVANRVVRALAGGWDHPGQMSKVARQGIETAGPVSKAEGSKLLETFLSMRSVFMRYPGLFPLLLEAVCGTELVIEGLTADFENNTENWTKHDIPRCDIVNQIGFLLLRLPKSQAAKYRKRLSAVLDGFAKTRPDGIASVGATYPIKWLDPVLNGKAGAERSGYAPGGKLSPVSLVHVCDDPAFVLASVKASGPPDASGEVDARLTFLGGQGVLDLEVSWWKKYKRGPKPAAAHARVVQQLGAISSDKIPPLMLDMALASKAKKAASDWFVEHADFARPFLEQAAAGAGKPAALATKLLKKLK